MNIWKPLARRLLFLVPHKHRLDVLARKYGTDKYLNKYTIAYERHFADIRRRRLNILEIGIGGGRHPDRGGESLRMWRDYFPNSMIYGLDIHDKRRHESRRIRVFQGDQNDPVFLARVAGEIGDLDIVIDDGSHVNEHMITSFRSLFPRVVDGGIYAIEDLSTAYWPEYGGEWERLNNDFTAVAMLKRLVDGLHYSKIPNYIPEEFDGSVKSIHFHHSIAFVIKGENKPRLSRIDHEVLDANRRD